MILTPDEVYANPKEAGLVDWRISYALLDETATVVLDRPESRS